MVQFTRRIATAGLLSMAVPVQGCATTSAQTATSACAPLAHYAARMAVELAPVHLALRYLYGDNARSNHGGVVNLVSEGRLADTGSNGETQQMRHSVEGTDMRVLMTIAEGHYPVIARRSAGISTLADLKGKRILGYRHTTAGYFLHKMLKTVGLTMADVTIIETPLGDVGRVAASGEVDAIAIWEPDSEQALHALRAKGEDVMIFSGEGIYHERYNFCSKAGALADPCKRREIVRLARAIIEVTAQINSNAAVAARAQQLVAESGGLYTPEEVAASWPNVKFVARFDPRLLDVCVEQDVWLAAEQNRTPRSREELAVLIDRSVYDEAVALPVSS